MAKKSLDKAVRLPSSEELFENCDGSLDNKTLRKLFDESSERNLTPETKIIITKRRLDYRRIPKCDLDNYRAPDLTRCLVYSEEAITFKELRESYEYYMFFKNLNTCAIDV